MKQLRQYIRNLILEDKASFMKDLTSHEGWKDIDFDIPRAVDARMRGRVAKAIWAKHVDRAFINSLIYVHYTDWDRDSIDLYFTPGKNKDEISCEAFIDEKDVRFVGNHGDIGLILKGHVTILADSEDELYTLGRESYDKYFPNMKRTSGINKGIAEVYPETYILGREDFRKPGWNDPTNEALLDNWEVQAISIRDDYLRAGIEKILQKNNISVPVVNPAFDDLSAFSNE